MRNAILFTAALLCCGAWADTIQVEGSSITKTVQLRPRDVVKVEAVDIDLTLQGQGDILHLDGSDNRVKLHGSLNGIVITGSNNDVKVVGPLQQLDVRGCDNRITLDGNCQLIQYGGSDNRTTWIRKPGRQQPKVERTGFNNEFVVSKPAP